MLQIMQAVSVCIGRDLLNLAGRYGIKPRTVLLLNNEDELAEIELRLRAVILQCRLTDKEIELLRGNLRYQSGYHAQLQVCATHPNTDQIAITNTGQEIEDYLKGNSIDVLMVDPLVSLHDAEENNNGAMDSVMGVIKGIAGRCGCAVSVLHHTRKVNAGGGALDVDEALRGASAVKDAARVIYLLSPMSPQDANAFGVDAEERGYYFRLDNGKRNYAPRATEATWYRQEAVYFDAITEDGEEEQESVGVPQYVDLKPIQEEKVEISIRAVLGWLHYEEWPVKVSQHYDKLKKHMDVGSDRRVRQGVECFPEGKNSAQKVTCGEMTYLVWRERENGKETGALMLFREEI